MKCLRLDLSLEGPEFVARFQREARNAARISHPNLVRVYDVDHRHGIHYLVMEYVAGETARQHVLRKGRLGEREALAIVLGAAEGLAAAHQKGIVHRDVKPDNVLIGQDGVVKVADLGLSKATGGDDSLQLSFASAPRQAAPRRRFFLVGEGGIRRHGQLAIPRVRPFQS